MATVLSAAPDPLGQALMQFGQSFGNTFADRGLAPLLGSPTSAQRRAAENQKLLEFQNALAQHQAGQLAPGVQGPALPMPQVPQFQNPETQRAALQAIVQQGQTPGQIAQQQQARQSMRHREDLHPAALKQAQQNVRAGYLKNKLTDKQFDLIEEDLKTGKANRKHINAQIEHLSAVDEDMKKSRRFLARTQEGKMAYQRWENLRDELATLQRMYSSNIEFVDDEGEFRFADPAMAASISAHMVTVMKQIQDAKAGAAEAIKGGGRRRKQGSKPTRTPTSDPLGIR